MTCTFSDVFSHLLLGFEKLHICFADSAQGAPGALRKNMNNKNGIGMLIVLVNELHSPNACSSCGLLTEGKVKLSSLVPPHAASFCSMWRLKLLETKK